MENTFAILSGEKAYYDQAENLRILRERKLYKIYSLLLIQKAGMRTAPTFVILDKKPNNLKKILSQWEFPLLLRFDFASARNSDLVIGGALIQTPQAVERIAIDILQRGFTPFFCVSPDRHNNLYSASVVMARHSNEIMIELVGEGFDAGDLKRGVISPHETLSYDTASDEISGKRIIQEADYQTSRLERTRRVAQISAYSDFVNKEGHTLANFDNLTSSDEEIQKALEVIPEHYRPCGKTAPGL